MGKFQDLTGQTFGRLTVIGRGPDMPRNNNRGRTRWWCKCDCGNPDLSLVLTEHLKSGKTKSCGCLRRETTISTHRKYNTYEINEEYVTGYTSNGDKFYFDIEDIPIVITKNWYKNNKGYIVSDTEKKNLLLHRLVSGALEEDVVDHINHLTEDCRKINLRKVTHNENMHNAKTKKNNTSGYTGVHWKKGAQRWIANLMINKKSIYLGCFKNFEDAVAARKAAEEKYFGEYSYDASMAYAAQYAIPEDDKTLISEYQPFLTPTPPKKKPSKHVKILPRFRVFKGMEAICA